MDFNRFTEKLQEGVRSAQSLASRRGQQQLDVEHLLVALLEQPSGLAPSILLKAEVNPETLHRRLMQDLDKLPRVSGTAVGIDQIYVTPRLQALLNGAENEAKRLKDEYVSVEHILLAASEEKSFKDVGLTRERLMKTLQEVRGSQRVTTQNLSVHAIDLDANLILIKGAVPGPAGGLVLVRTPSKGGAK